MRFKVGNTDLSQIECRVLNTLAGQWDVIEKFRAGTDIYSELASKFYGFPVDKSMAAERGVGKQLELSCGYGAGGPTIVRTARAGTYGPPVCLSDAQGLQARDLYRTTHPFVTALWEKASTMLWALREGSTIPWGPPGQTTPCMTVHDHRLFHNDSGVWIDYTSLERVFIEEEGEIWRMKVRHGWRKMYGARLIQNICELLARQIIAHAMVRVAQMGYRVPLTVHDNIYTIIPLDRGDPQEQLETIRREVMRPVAWLERCPIEAEAELKEALA